MLKWPLLSLLTIASFISGCTSSTPQSESKIIVTTFVPYQVFAQNLVGTNAQVINLIDNTQEPHDYQLKPSDIITLQKADLIIRNGLGIDDWVEEAARKNGTKAAFFTASDYIAPIPPKHGLALVANTNEDENHNDTFDPHIWVSPKNVLQILPHLNTKLSDIDPTHQQNYQENFDRYSARLKTLDHQITAQLEPFHDQEFISFHEAFQYFAQDYGLVSATAIEAYPGKEPTPKYIQALIEIIKTKNIKAIFSEPQFSPRIVETLAHDLNLKVYSLDPLETGTYSSTLYEDKTLENVQNIVDAFNL